MIQPGGFLLGLKQHIRKEWKLAFFSALLVGLAVHMPILVSDIPNHDGLASMYFDQNMITSGRWFLTIACGFSSYYTLPWLIGLLGLIFLGAAAVCLTELLELKEKVTIVLVSGLLVVFPALASTFAYVFTLDGYMLALLLAIAAVLLTKKYKKGFLFGALCLAFSMGTYQAYLPFAIVLCIYLIGVELIRRGLCKDLLKTVRNYLLMGVLGMGAYFGILFLLLRLQGKTLANYQGINNLEGTASLTPSGGFVERLVGIYRDFLAFTVKGGILVNNGFALVAMGILALTFLASLVWCLGKKGYLTKWWIWVCGACMILVLPMAFSVIRIISPDLNYHLLMRYQWVLFPILFLAGREKCDEKDSSNRAGVASWGAFLAAAVLLFNYAVTDNIAYSNLQKRYEKTYAYCLRLLDRIEQTEGYYQGIPIAMIGVVGDQEFPVTDITRDVTKGMIGISGDSLLYTGANYEAFMKNYLGATLNFLEPEAMSSIYYSPEYREMSSFPGADSTKVVDGILYVKTENME